MSATSAGELALNSVPVPRACYTGRLTFGSDALRPLFEGHTILAPKRRVARLADLTEEEGDELFGAIRDVQRALLADSTVVAFNVAMKDGAGAGQPVPHAHVHVLPRRVGDLQRNDDVYSLLDNWAPDDRKRSVVQLEVPADSDRAPRTEEAMANEAAQYSGRAVPLVDDEVKFGKFDVDRRQVFFATPLSLAIVNLKPLVPGHVLLIPRRVVPTLRDLSDDEASDLWRAARHVHRLLLDHYSMSSANLAIQDGPHAGQSVPHVHVHILPRP